MKLVYSAKMTSLDKVFREIGNGIENIAKDDDTMKQSVGLTVAQDLMETIQKKYIENLNNISSYEHGSSDIRTYITDTKKGYVVHVSGKDVLYQEYGTGTRGLRKPHPAHKRDGMNPYGSGRNIIHMGEKNNGKETPYWYKLYRDFPGYLPNDFNDEAIRATDYVWRHNKIITKGLPAGRFIYDSCQEYRKSGGFGEKDVLTKTVNQTIKKDFVNKMNKTVKKVDKDADYYKKTFDLFMRKMLEK